MASPGGLFVNLISTFDDSGLKKANGSLSNSEKSLESFKTKATAAFAAAGIAVAAYAGKLLVDGVKAAAEDEKAQVKLATALQNSTDATDAQVASIEDYILKTSLATGVADDQLRPSFEKLAIATGDLTKAQELQTLAMDIAAGTGKSLDSVSLALAKAYNGNVSALTRLGVPLSENILKTKDFDKATRELSEAFGGQASVQADTFEGKMARLQITMDEAKETIGAVALDALQPLIEKIMEVANAWNNLNPGVQQAVLIFGVAGAAVLGTVVAVTKLVQIFMAARAAYAAITAAQISLNLAFLSNPIFLVIAAIVALIAIFVVAYNKIEWFREGVNKAFAQIKEWIVGAATAVKNAWDKVWKFFESFLPAAVTVFKAIANAITRPFRSAFNLIADLWNSTIGKFKITIPDWVPIIGGKTFEFPKMPKIPELAEGGIVKKPTLAIIGEAGPEAVVPLSRGRRYGIDPVGRGITINVSGALDPEAVARQIETILKRSRLRAGNFA